MHCWLEWTIQINRLAARLWKRELHSAGELKNLRFYIEVVAYGNHLTIGWQIVV